MMTPFGGANGTGSVGAQAGGYPWTRGNGPEDGKIIPPTAWSSVPAGTTPVTLGNRFNYTANNQAADWRLP